MSFVSRLFCRGKDMKVSLYTLQDYAQQAQQVKAAYVGLYGMGAQCHFGVEVEPDPVLIKVRTRRVMAV